MTSYTISGCAGAQSNLGTAPISAPTGKKAQILGLVGLVGLAASSGIFLSLAGTHASMISSCGVAAGSSAVVKMLGLSALGTVLGTGGALAVLYIALLVGIVGCWLIYKQSTNTSTIKVEDNFRSNGLIAMSLAGTKDRAADTEEELMIQIKKDENRYQGMTNVDALLKAIKAEQDPQIRENMLFANSQKFETSLARWCTPLFGDGHDISIIQSQGSLDFSPIVCDVDKRTTTVTSQLKAIRFVGRDMEILETFTVRATFDWDTAQVTITKTPIQPRS